MRIPIIGALLILACAPPLLAQNWPGRAIRLVPGGAEVLDSPNASPRRVFGDTTPRWVVSPSVAPDGNWIALIRYEPGRVEGTSYTVNPLPVVFVVDAGTGGIQFSVRGGISYLWCGPDCIAVLYGTYNEGSEGGPYGDSLAVFRASTGALRMLFKVPNTGLIAPTWFPQDSSIVASAWSGLGRSARHSFLRLDFSTGVISETEAREGAISGSGRFVHRYVEGDSWITRAGTGTAMLTPNIDGRWQVEEWLGRTDKVLLLQLPPLRPRVPGGPRPRVRPSAPHDPNAPPAERTYRIWDVAGGTVSGEWKAAETAWRGPAPNGCRLFLRDGKLTAAPGCR